MFTEANLEKIFGRSEEISAELAAALNKTCERFDIDTRNRRAGFIAQIGHESAAFKFRVENLNYSAQGLRKIFPKYFPTDALAAAYARQPEKIANRVYASRMGNGDEKSGDGWKFRGKGFIQITGKFNTANFAKFMEMSIDDALKYLLTLEGACMSAGWYWASNGLNAFADKEDILALTKRINGGTIGLDDRKAKYAKARAVLI